MTLLYFKALHLIGVIVWFAGLFYLGRLFVYHREAHERPEPERRALKAQFALMESGFITELLGPACASQFSAELPC